jgi:hypothetical protein
MDKDRELSKLTNNVRTYVNKSASRALAALVAYAAAVERLGHGVTSAMLLDFARGCALKAGFESEFDTALESARKVAESARKAP